MSKIMHTVWWEAITQEERDKLFNHLLVEDSPEEKARMAELRKQVEAEIAAHVPGGIVQRLKNVQRH